MNDGSSNNSQRGIVSPMFDFDRGQLESLASVDRNLIFQFSPFQFDKNSPLAALNFNSPNLRKNDSNEQVQQETRGTPLFPKEEQEWKFKPKLNPKVLSKKLEKRRLFKENGLIKGPTVDTLSNLPARKPSDSDLEDLMKCSVLAPESTVFESTYTAALRTALPPATQNNVNRIFFSDTEDEDERSFSGPALKKSDDLPVRKLIKMEPLFTFFVQHYNNSQKQTEMTFQHKYELLIIKALLRHTGCKNVDSLALNNQVLTLCLQTAWKTPLRSRYHLIVVLKAAFHVLRVRLRGEKAVGQLKIQEQKEFTRKHYFNCISHVFPEVLDIDLESSKGLKKLTKKQLALMFTSPVFAKDFEDFMNQDFVNLMNSYRANRLLSVFCRMEDIFLSMPSEQEAVNAITKWIYSSAFLWVYPTWMYLKSVEQIRKR